MAREPVKIPDHKNDDSESIAKLLTIGVTAVTWFSVPFAFRYVEAYREVFGTFHVEPIHAAGIFLDCGSVGVALILGVLGTCPAVLYFATKHPKPKILIAGICGVLVFVLWVSMTSSFQSTFQLLESSLKR